MAWRPNYGEFHSSQYPRNVSRGRRILGDYISPRHQGPSGPHYNGMGWGYGRGRSKKIDRCQASASSSSSTSNFYHHSKNNRRPGDNFSYHIPNEVVQKHLDVLQEIWLDDSFKDKKAKFSVLYEVLCDILAEQANPWEMAYSLFTMTADYRENKATSLSFQIIVEFEKWVRSRDNPFLGRDEEFISEELCIRVFHATESKVTGFYSVAFKAFSLCHPGNEYFIPFLRPLLEKKKITEVSGTSRRFINHTYIFVYECLASPSFKHFHFD